LHRQWLLHQSWHASRLAKTVNKRWYNIGNNRPEKLMDFIGAIEKAVGKKAVIEFYPMQPGMCIKPTPTWMIWCGTPALSQVLPSMQALRSLWIGIRGFILSFRQ
jgi:hypothetical protein